MRITTFCIETHCAELREHEYYAMLMIGEALSPISAATDDSDARCETAQQNSGFGLQLTAKVAKVALLETVPAAHSFPILESLLHRNGVDARSLLHENTDSFALCVSIIDPKVSLCLGSTSSTSTTTISSSDGIRSAAMAASAGSGLVTPVSLQRQSKIFLSIRADDVYMFELTRSQYNTLCADGFQFHCRDASGVQCDPLSIGSARCGAEKFRMPFIRRINGPGAHAARSGGREQHYNTLLSDNTQFGHAFEVRLLLDTIRTGEEASSMKSVHFYIDFHDIILSHDPRSTWLLKVVHLLTPQNARRMLEHQRLQRYEQGARLFDALPEEQKLGLDLDALLEDDVSSSPLHSSTSEGESDVLPPSQPAAALPFEVTKLNVRVRDCIIDYICCSTDGSAKSSCSADAYAAADEEDDPFHSRVQLVIGLLTLNSTIVSNSPKICMKFKLAGVSFRVGKVLDWHHHKSWRSAEVRYVEMAAMDRMDIQMLMDGEGSCNGGDVGGSVMDVTTDEARLEGIVLLVDAGLCSVSACVDSIDLLAVRLPPASFYARLTMFID